MASLRSAIIQVFAVLSVSWNGVWVDKTVELA